MFQEDRGHGPFKDSTLDSLSLRGREFRRILIIKPSSLGDVVHALPVLHGLRTRYPEARIDWLIGSSCRPLLEGHPQVSELIEFDRQQLKYAGTSWKATRLLAGLVRTLRLTQYDVAIDLQGLFRSGFLTWATGAQVRIGFGDAREGARFFYNVRLPGIRESQHAVDRYYQVAPIFGFEQVPIRFDLPLTHADRTAAAALLTQHGAHLDAQRIVMLVPGARWETKVWPASRFVQTVEALHDEENVFCVLLGGSDEADLCHEIAKGCRRPPVNLAGQTSVRQLIALLATAEVVVCLDSAAAHLAAALNRPLVCLTGPTNPCRTGPYRRGGDVIRLDLDCAPCYLRKRSQCHYGHRCMLDLPVDRVVEAVRARICEARLPISAM